MAKTRLTDKQIRRKLEVVATGALKVADELERVLRVIEHDLNPDHVTDIALMVGRLRTLSNGIGLEIRSNGTVRVSTTRPWVAGVMASGAILLSPIWSGFAEAAGQEIYESVRPMFVSMQDSAGDLLSGFDDPVLYSNDVVDIQIYPGDRQIDVAGIRSEYSVIYRSSIDEPFKVAGEEIVLGFDQSSQDNVRLTSDGRTFSIRIANQKAVDRLHNLAMQHSSASGRYIKGQFTLRLN